MAKCIVNKNINMFVIYFASFFFLFICFSISYSYVMHRKKKVLKSQELLELGSKNLVESLEMISSTVY